MLEQCEDRANPTPTITIQALSDGHEGGTNAVFRLTRSDTSDPLVSGTASFSGTATAGSDYSSFGTAYWSFGIGAATTDVTVFITDDSTSEPTETITLTLDSGSGYTVGSPSSATANLFDNDAQYVSVAKIDDTTEGGTASKFTFTRIGDLSSSLTANFTVSGTATSGTDFTSLGTTVTFAANSATADKSVTALADNVVEGSETVVATVTSGTGYSVGSPSSATVTIADDPPVVWVEAADTFEGAATGGFSFLRSGGDLSSSLAITYTVTGTATSTTDYEALSGTVTFDAGEDRVEVPVTAYGDNINDDGETVIATIDDGGTDYTIDGDAGDATVTISDQPLTISVIALNDGAEGTPTNATFRFLRSGDLSTELTVTYTVSGTATSGSDYTALSGSVTFGIGDDHKDVTVYVQNDSTAEPTETVTVTLDEADTEDEQPDYILGNDSDTVFITDANTNRITWLGGTLGYANDWDTAANWSTNAVPTQYDDVYFDGNYSSINCTNAGDGLGSTGLYGLHIIGSYSGTLTLANALSVSTFEQTSGTLNQPSARDLTITAALLWNGGTLGGTDDGASVIADGAAGRIDPPDSGSMSTSSTFRIVGSAIVNFLPGTLNFAGGSGVYDAGEMKILASGGSAQVSEFSGTITTAKIEVATGKSLLIRVWTRTKIGEVVSALPILNSGTIGVDTGIRVTVSGRLGTDGPSIQQAAGYLNVKGGSDLYVTYGMSVTGGNFNIDPVDANPMVTIVCDDPHTGLTVTGGQINILGAHTGVTKFGTLRVEGDVNWTGGTYVPWVSMSDENKASLWQSTYLFTVGANAVFDRAASGTGTAKTWMILEGSLGIDGNTGDAGHFTTLTGYQLLQGSGVLKKWWSLHKT